MIEKKNIPNEIMVTAQHLDYKTEIAELVRSRATPGSMRERILAYHENDIADDASMLRSALEHDISACAPIHVT